MSYNVGVYTIPAGATTAFAGQVIASATWNSIFSDLQTALNQIGLPGATGTTPIVVSTSITATDNPIVVGILPGFTRYRVGGIYLNHASATTVNTGTVNLFTAAGATGVNLVVSVTICIGSTAESTQGNFQLVSCSIANNITVTSSVLYLRMGVAGTGTMGVTLALNMIS